MAASQHHRDPRVKMAIAQFATSVMAILGPVLGILYLFWQFVLKYPLNDLYPLLVVVQSEHGQLAAHQQPSDSTNIKVTWATEKNDPQTEASIHPTLLENDPDHSLATSETKLPPLTIQQAVPATLAGLTSHLYSTGRLRGPFRAFWYHLLLSLPYAFARPVLSRALSDELIVFISKLLVAPFMAAWVRSALFTTPTSSKFARFPPLRSTFQHTWRVHLIDALVAATTRFAANKLMKTVDLVSRRDLATLVEEIGHREAWVRLREALFLIVATWILTELPKLITSALVYRVHVSLLPQGETTIIPVDRRFRQSLLLPQQNPQEQQRQPGVSGEEVVEGEDAAAHVIRVSDAWRSLTWTVWFRLGMLKLQILALQAGVLAIGFLLFFFVLLQTMKPKDEL